MTDDLKICRIQVTWVGLRWAHEHKIVQAREALITQ